MSAAAQVTADHIRQKLRERYPEPKWATFTELRDAAGFDAARSCDFFAMHTWPSQGFMRVAVEIKVSRGDFLRELGNPEKRRFFEENSHEFYFATPARMVKPEELPEGLGLLEVTNKSIRAKVRAKQSRPADQMDASLVAVMLKAAAAERAALARQQDGFAEFAGRSLSLDDVRQLADKVFALKKWEIEDRIRRDLREERRRVAKSADGSESWRPVVRVLRETARAALGQDWRGEPTPDDVIEWLKMLPHREVGQIARHARVFADRVLGGAS